MAQEIIMPRPPTYQIVTDSRTGAPISLFYREAGPKDAPVVLLLHGFPTSSHQYRGLIGRLSDKYRVFAPDLPGFGFSDAPDAKSFGYTSDRLAEVIESFADAIGLGRYALYPELPSALHEGQPWGSPGIEPRLCEVLADPVIHAVMRRDGVCRATLESVVVHAQRRLSQCHDGVNTGASSTSSNDQGASKKWPIQVPL